MKTIQLDNITQKDIVENNLFIYRQNDKTFIDRLNSAIDYTLNKLVKNDNCV